MKITRVIDGKTVEIELTPAEMEQAANERKEQAYYTYLKNRISDLDDDDDRAFLKQLEGDALQDALDAMEIDFEILVEERGYDWDDAWNRVSDDYTAKVADEANQGTL